MKYSEYKVIESTGSSVDPLGFLRPSSAIADGLFRQFTVLSNHPAYHGFLCFLFQYFEEKGIKPGSVGFSKQFRDMEAFWGILNAKADTSILNITKYQDIAKKENVTLAAVQKYSLLYARLNYGTLGHYSSPSIFWGLLNQKGTQLSDLGRRLGKAWSIRQGIDFKKLIDKWATGKGYEEIDPEGVTQKAFNISAAPEQVEKAVWKDVIEKYCQKNPVINPLWVNPVPAQIMELANGESAYAGFFPGVLEHYKDFPELYRRVELAARFEEMSGYIQFAFEWEYVKRLDEVRAILPAAPKIEAFIQKAIPLLATEYMGIGGVDNDNFFRPLAVANGYKLISEIILRHHAAHQKSKGATAFISGNDVVVKDRVNKDRFLYLSTMVDEEDGGVGNAIAYRYKRFWYFDRADLWIKYSGGMA